MARIRCIKPEFPQSETIGALSRDARLLFIMLWTIVDDEGRARGSSRMLASLLYPYDDDAPKLIAGWLGELEAAKCVRLYAIEGNSYIDIPNWLKHQKIDHKSDSRIPSFDEASRILASPRETLAPDLGPRTLDQDQGKIPEPSGSGPTQAELEREFFRRGKQVCGANAGGLLTTLLKAKEYDVSLARSVIEMAATKNDAREYVAAATRIKTNADPRSGSVITALDNLLNRTGCDSGPNDLLRISKG